MMRPTCSAPIEHPALVEYWLGELGEAAEERLDLHLLGCSECNERLAEIVALVDGVRAAFAHGAVRAFVTDAFVRRLTERGIRVREYRVPHNGSVNCAVAPEDDLLVSRMEAPLAGVGRLDAVSYLADAPVEVFRDIPFNAASGEVVVAQKIALIRTMPSHQYRMRLVAVGESGERVIGDYTFNHTAHAST